MKRSVVIRKAEISATLSVPPSEGKRLLEPFASFAKKHQLPFSLLEDTNIENDAEVHTEDGDLWLCLEGEPTFTVGGTLLNPSAKKRADGSLDEHEWKGKEIESGEIITLYPGDWLWIPAGQPHQHRCKGTARLVIIKIPGAKGKS